MEQRKRYYSRRASAMAVSCLVAVASFAKVHAFSSPITITGRNSPLFMPLPGAHLHHHSMSGGFIRRRKSLCAVAQTQKPTVQEKTIAAASSAVNNGQNSKKNTNQAQKKKRSNQQVSRQKRHEKGPSSSLNLRTGELKLLTEYHLSQNIQQNGSISIGNMTSGQMHEFSRLISAWSKRTATRRQDKLLAAEMAEQCLLELIEEKKAGNAVATKMITPDLYYLVIKAWLKVGSYKDLAHATSLLDLMERIHKPTSKDERDLHDKFVSSSMKCYVTIINGWAKSNSIGSEIKAEEILSRMGEVGKKYGVDRRDVRHYNNVMNRIATSGKVTAGEEAERLLREMIASYKQAEEEAALVANNNTTSRQSTAASSSSSSTLAPNRNSFNTVIKAYANAGGKNAVSNALRILSMMENVADLGLSSNIATQIIPDKISYTSILMSYANINHKEIRRREDAGKRAEELLNRMMEIYDSSGKGNGDVKPDTVTYNAVLKVWSKCGHPDAGERSEALLNKMLQLYEAGDPDVIPDDVSFNTVIHTIANSNAVEAPQQAMRLLKRMEECHETGMVEAKPDIISYNSVLNAFAKSGGSESAKLAEEMLDNLEKAHEAGVWNIRPDVYSYNIVISAWGKCGNANKAVALLDRMMTSEETADLKPDVTTYNSVLHAWSQSFDRNAPVKALGLLEIMLRLHEGGDKRASPDVTSFSTVINAFSKSKFPRKARQTRDLLRRMKHLYEKGQRNVKPNVYVYAAVLNACAYTFGRAEEKEEALKIGIETYEELQSSPDIVTNHVVYGSFIRVCRRLMPPDSHSNHFITRAFKQCCSDGQLGEYVLRQLRPVPNLYLSLLQSYIPDGEDEVNYDDLPVSWTCNVKDKQRR